MPAGAQAGVWKRTGCQRVASWADVPQAFHRAGLLALAEGQDTLRHVFVALWVWSEPPGTAACRCPEGRKADASDDGIWPIVCTAKGLRLVVLACHATRTGCVCRRAVALAAYYCTRAALRSSSGARAVHAAAASTHHEHRLHGEAPAHHVHTPLRLTNTPRLSKMGKISFHSSVRLSPT